MKRYYEQLTMKHLMGVAFGFVAIGIVWMVVVWMSSIDNLWLVPGVFLILSGTIKAIAVQIWVKVAKLGTDEHKPIKAL